MSAQGPYRENEFRDEGERRNRLWDDRLYFAPLRRIFTLVLMSAPMIAFSSIVSKFSTMPSIVAALCYVLLILMALLPMIPFVFESPASPKIKVICVAYGPVTLLFFLGRWIAYGHYLPKAWRFKL